VILRTRVKFSVLARFFQDVHDSFVRQDRQYGHATRVMFQRHFRLGIPLLERAGHCQLALQLLLGGCAFIRHAVLVYGRKSAGGASLPGDVTGAAQ
jgi:hypothetical protein